MIKKLMVIAGCITVILVFASCDQTRRNPGRAYMPDMVYSRAYETYAPAQERLDHSSAAGAHYNARPVEGTIARGDLMAYSLKNDTTGYKESGAVKNPLDTAAMDMKEAERLYLVNCAICHGSKLDGNGPLYNGGNGPFSAAPKNLMADDSKAMAEGTIFHVETYGKGQMGSYASQMTSMQRWMVAVYVKSKQAGVAMPAGTDSATTSKADSAVAKKM